MTTLFIPNKAGMTKRKIAEWWNEEIADNNYNAAHDDPDNSEFAHIDVKVRATELSDALAQEFVNKEYNLIGDLVDADEEDFVVARSDLILACIKKYVKALK